MEEKIRVLIVCTGNICRSPTAEVVLADMARHRGFPDLLEVHSAGTQAYHVGEGADARSTEHARRRGYDLSRHQARKFRAADLEEYDWVLCMDRSHLEHVQGFEHEHQRANVGLFLDFATGSARSQDMPDPYYGGERGFENVLDLCENAGNGFIDRILLDDLEESSRRG